MKNKNLKNIKKQMHKMGKSNVLMEVGENIAEIKDNLKKAMKKK